MAKGCVQWRKVLMAGFGLMLAFAAYAHALSVSHLDIRPMDGGGLRIELDLAIRDVALSLPLDADHNERVTWGELQAVRKPLYEMVLSDLAVSSASGPCVLRPIGLGTRQYNDGGYATVMLDAGCRSLAELKLHYALLFDVDPQHRALVTYRDATGTGTAIASPGQEDVAIGSGPERTPPFLQFLREGIHHILIGYDHLAFLVSLLLPAALVRHARAWHPAAGFSEVLGHVLGIVTAFTLAHSITLSLAALGWVTPASSWVEAAIAASVMLAALNNIHPVVVKRAWIVSFGFGLVHGFGFAGALSELGLPTGARVAALLGFNLGVEIGQLAVVSLVLPVLFLLREKPWYAPKAMPLMSFALAALAGWWLYLRLRG